jgi:hypothetical protein
MHNKHQWMFHTLLDMIVFCELNGLTWQGEVLLDALAALGLYQGDLIAAFNKMSLAPTDGDYQDNERVDRARVA